MSAQACGPFSQTLFLGASVISFSSSLGWNGEQGSLTVELVQDSCGGSKVYYDSFGQAKITNQPDFFNPPKLGSPVYFRFGNFRYGGILQNWEEQVDPKGGKTYRVNCTDAIEILEGCQVIINNYTGSTFGVPNLINAFGYNEDLFSSCSTANANLATLNPPLGYVPSPGFGGSNIAEDGMSWFQIREAIQTLSVFPSLYGGQLKLRDTRFYLDITELPTLDANFRLTGDSTTVLQAISQVCQAAGIDFFVELLYFAPNFIDNGYGGISGHLHPDVMKFIKIRTVRRDIQQTAAYNVDFTVGSPIDLRLNFGKISQFVGTGDGRVRSARGLELRHDITNSFLVGDNRQDMWMQPYNGSQDTFTDTIWPYWGKDVNGFPIISQNINDDHNFTISTVSFGPDLISILGSGYNMKMVELRAALSGMEEWSLYLWSEKQALAEALDIDSSFTTELVNTLESADVKPKPDDFKKTDSDSVERAFKQAGGDPDGQEIDFAELQKRLYDIVRAYAELAGKKFLVALPVICSAFDNNAPFTIKTNWEPSDGAWVDGDIQISPLAESLSQFSPIIELMRLDDGRIGGFVYFNTGSSTKLIDYSQLSPDEVIPISETECYVKANVEEILFLNPQAITYPRAVISLNSPITVKALDSNEIDAKIVDSLIGWLTEVPRSWLDKKASSFGDDTNKLSLSPMPLLPQGAAVPLRSTVLSYGPWITTLAFGPAAKTNYERDTSLSPWAFGSTQVMNYAGQIKVESEVTQQIVEEAGSFTIPGPPPGSLGEALLSGGPEMTNIDVEVSTGGVTSSVRMRTWIRNFGELGRRRIQNLRHAGNFQQKLQRAFLKGSSIINSSVFAQLTRPFAKSDRFDRHSSHTIIAGEYLDDYDDPTYKRANVVLTDLRKILPELHEDYEQKAFMELGGLFRPFETIPLDNNLPGFTIVEPSEATPATSASLNPFKLAEEFNGDSVGHDIEYIARGDSIPTDLSIKKAGAYSTNRFRGLGLRAPVVLVGWGFDINGKPVPNANSETPNDDFITDYLQKPHLWKAGPLDVRWNENRGVWQASGGSGIKRARLTSDLLSGTSASAVIITYDLDLNMDVDGDSITVFDYLLPDGNYILSGTNIFYMEEEESGRKFVVAAACT